MSRLSPRNSSEIPDPLSQLTMLATAPENMKAAAVQARNGDYTICEDDMQT